MNCATKTELRAADPPIDRSHSLQISGISAASAVMATTVFEPSSTCRLALVGKVADVRDQRLKKTKAPTSRPRNAYASR